MRTLHLYLSIVVILLIPVLGHTGPLIEKVSTCAPAADNVYPLNWTFSQPATASVFISDLQGNIIKTIVNNEWVKAADHAMSWDGVDEHGIPAPAGLYVPIIRAKSKTLGMVTYNPTSQPWGEEVIPEDLAYDSEKGVISYSLAKRAYCRLRVGETDGGPLYATVAGWKLRDPGTYEEPWNGLDASGIVKPAEKSTFRVSLDAFTVPANVMVINRSTNVKPVTTTKKALRKFPIHPPHGDQIAFYPSLPNGLQPDLHITTGFSGEVKKKKGRYILKGEVAVKVELESGVIDNNPAETKELMLFLDGKLVREDKIDSLPASMTFDTAKMSKGNHILTINLRTSGDRAASSSMKIFITK